MASSIEEWADVPPYVEANQDVRKRDHKGRLEIAEMYDQEKIDEILNNSRQVQDLVNDFMGDLKSGKINPMSLIMGKLRG